MLPGFLGQVQSDFEMICGAEYSEVVTFSDGTTSVTLTGLFDAASAHFDPESQSHVINEAARITVAETSTDFDLRRPGLQVQVRGSSYKVRKSDWEYDGLGQLILYLDPVR